MGFLEQSRQRGRLGRLRKQLESEPRPHGLADLARGYLALGEPRVATEVVDFALRHFPDSVEVKRLAATLRGEDLDARLRDAKIAVRERSSVAAWLELADAYRALGREDQYGTTLREALERFQQDSTVLTQLADLRYRRFLTSYATPDGKTALDLALRAIDADRENLKARFQVAELLYRIGAVKACRAQLSALLELAPEHERAVRLTREIAAIDDSVERDVDLLSHFAQVEERMDFVHPTMPWDPAPARASAVEDNVDPLPEIDRLQDRPHVHEVVYFDTADGMHSRRCSPGFADSVQQLAAASHRAVRGMELGSPISLTIEGADRALVIQMKRNSALGALLAPDASLNAVVTAACDVLERLTRSA
jgi:tetratricopeptide (TPR) repeat protein